MTPAWEGRKDAWLPGIRCTEAEGDSIRAAARAAGGIGIARYLLGLHHGAYGTKTTVLEDEHSAKRLGSLPGIRCTEVEREQVTRCAAEADITVSRYLLALHAAHVARRKKK